MTMSPKERRQARKEAKIRARAQGDTIRALNKQLKVARRQARDLEAKLARAVDMNIQYEHRIASLENELAAVSDEGQRYATALDQIRKAFDGLVDRDKIEPKDDEERCVACGCLLKDVERSPGGKACHDCWAEETMANDRPQEHEDNHE